MIRYIICPVLPSAGSRVGNRVSSRHSCPRAVPGRSPTLSLQPCAPWVPGTLVRGREPQVIHVPAPAVPEPPPCPVPRAPCPVPSAMRPSRGHQGLITPRTRARAAARGESRKNQVQNAGRIPWTESALRFSDGACDARRAAAPASPKRRRLCAMYEPRGRRRPPAF